MSDFVETSKSRNAKRTYTREYMLINGFETDEALAAVELWADSVPAVGGTSE